MKMARARTHWFRDFVSDVGVAGDGETLRVGFAVGSLFPFRERWPGTSEGFEAWTFDVDRGGQDGHVLRLCVRTCVSKYPDGESS